MLKGADGQPTHLFSGVVDATGYTHTIAVPLKTTDSDLAAVRASIMRQLVPSTSDASLDREVSKLAQALNATGAWSDVPYADGGRSWWGAAEHLRRVLLMASAQASPHSAHHGSPPTHAAAQLAFHW